MSNIAIYENTSVPYKYIEQVLKLMPDAVVEVFDNQPFNPVMAASLITSICSGQVKNGFFAVAVQDDNVVGFFGGFISNYVFSNVQFAQDVVVYVRPSARHIGVGAKLGMAFEAWAKENNAREIRVTLSNKQNQDYLLSAIEKRGYQQTSIVAHKIL